MRKTKRQPRRDDVIRARLSAELRALCAKKGMTQHDLARAIRRVPSSVCRAINGKHGQLDIYDCAAEPFGYELGFVRKRKAD